MLYVSGIVKLVCPLSMSDLDIVASGYLFKKFVFKIGNNLLRIVPNQYVLKYVSLHVITLK